MLLDDIVDIEGITGGSNCLTFRGRLSSVDDYEDLIVKVLERPIPDKETEKLILEDYLDIRKKAIDRGVSVPRLRECSVVDNENFINRFRTAEGKHLYIIEAYTGISVREIFREVTFKDIRESVLKMCFDFINSLPEDIPLDTNPGNITYLSKENKLYFVDFLPPDPWKNTEKNILQTKLQSMFPTMENILKDKDSKDRYFKNEFRKGKLQYYLDQYSAPA